MATKLVNGIEVRLTKEELLEMKERELDHKKAQALLAATEYRRLRREAYPPIEDQLDMIYHHGIDQWKAHIEDIKNMYPKPE